MADLNRVTILGRSGTNAELKYTKQGTPVLGLSIATSKNTAKYGEPAKWETTWHKVVFWGKLGETLAARVQKGTKLWIEGEITVREWEKDGIKRQSVEITARSAEVIEKISSDSDSSFRPSDSTFSESDIPF